MFPTKRMITCVFLLGIGAIGVIFAVSAKEEPQKHYDKSQEAARRRSAKNLQTLMNALWSYHEINDHFPPTVIYDKNGKALLSWRVLLLPYLEQDELFAQFHLNEPWDSAQNKPLLAKMPKLYAPPLPGKTKEKHATFYQVFVGKGTAFEGKEGASLADMADGTSNTVAIVEAAEAVPWSKPADLPYDDKKPLPKLGGLFGKGINAAFVDGSAWWLKKDFDVPTMRLAIKRNDGFPADFNKLRAEN